MDASCSNPTVTRSPGCKVKVGSVSDLVSELTGDGDPASSEVALDAKLQTLGRRTWSSFEKHVEDVERTKFFR